MTENNKKRFVNGALFLFLAFLFFYPWESSADVGLSVAPQKYEMTVFPGSSQKGQLKVHNPSAVALPVNLKIIPFGAQDKTGDIIIGEATAPENPVSWIELEESNFLLAPKENKRINFEITVPSGAPEGGYYMFVQFQLRIPDFRRERHGVKAVPSVGIPILIATTELALGAPPERENLMEIASFGVVPESRVGFLENILGGETSAFFTDRVFAEEGNSTRENSIGLQVVRGQPDHFVLLIRNNDVFHFHPQGTLTVYDSLNREVVKKEVDEQIILPGMSRQFELKKETEEGSSGFFLSNIFANLMVGRYRAELDLVGQSPVHAEIIPSGGVLSLSIFSTTPFIFWIILLTLFSLVFFGKERIKMARKALFQS